MPVPPPLCVPILMKCYASAVVFHLEIEKEHCLAGAVEGENISEQARKFKKSLELLLCNLSPHQSPSLLFRIEKGHLTKHDHFSNCFANVVLHHYTADSLTIVIFSLFSFNFPTGGLIIWISFFSRTLSMLLWFESPPGTSSLSFTGIKLTHCLEWIPPATRLMNFWPNRDSTCYTICSRSRDLTLISTWQKMVTLVSLLYKI